MPHAVARTSASRANLTETIDRVPPPQDDDLRGKEGPVERDLALQAIGDRDSSVSQAFISLKVHYWRDRRPCFCSTARLRFAFPPDNSTATDSPPLRWNDDANVRWRHLTNEKRHRFFLSGPRFVREMAPLVSNYHQQETGRCSRPPIVSLSIWPVGPYNR